MARPYGYRTGERIPVLMPVDASTSAISAGDFLALGTPGYVQQAAAGNRPVGVAMADCSVPGSDGALSVLVDVSTDSVYEFPPDTGSATAALLMTLVDVGGAQSIDIDATTDKVFRVVKVDTVNNTVWGQIVLATA